MAPFRKKYLDRRIEDDTPVTVPPTEAAKPPPVVDAPKPAEPLEAVKEERSPADEAAANAIKARIAEMDRAAEHARSAPQPPPTLASEPPPSMEDPFERAISHLPDRVKGWYRSRPQLLTDPEGAARVQYAHHVAAREVGEQFTDPYYQRMEVMLGLRQPERVAAPKVSAPPRPAVPMSAPVQRDAPSFSTGRPANSPVQLTGEQRQLARTLGLTDDQYRKGVERMNREKAGGFHQDGQ